MIHSDTCTIVPLAAADRAAWERLAHGYHEFYGETVPPESYDRTWVRLLDGNEIAGIGATRDGRLIGIAHFLFHEHVWQGTVCYLQDLFVEPAARSAGVGRALIEALSDIARARGAFRLYWTTAHDNAGARRLYDRVAELTNFLRYDRAL